MSAQAIEDTHESQTMQKRPMMLNNEPGGLVNKENLHIAKYEPILIHRHYHLRRSEIHISCRDPHPPRHYRTGCRRSVRLAHQGSGRTS